MQKTLLGIMLTSTLTVFYGKFVEVGVNSKGKIATESFDTSLSNTKGNDLTFYKNEVRNLAKQHLLIIQ